MMRGAWLFAALIVASPVLAQDQYWEPHFISRTATVAFHTSNVGTGKTLILGESNTEAFWWTSVNGCFVVNGGMGGARIRDIAERADYIASVTKPRILHLMTGGNNFLAADHPEWLSMEADLNTIIDAFQAQGSKIVVWPVPPVDASLGGSFPLAKRAEINALLASVATQQGVFWDWWWPNQITQGTHVGGVVTNNFALAGAMQPDGAHFSASTQSSRYNRIEAWRQYFVSIGWPCQ